MKHTMVLVSLMLLPLHWAAAQATKPAGRSADDVSERLDQPFISRAAGISFRPPAGGTMSRRSVVGKDIVQYTNVQDKWTLRVSQLVFERPTQLDNPDAKSGTVLEETAHQIRLQNSATTILRRDVVNVGQHDVGLIISRFTQGNITWLRQQAFIRMSSRWYYVFDLTTPSGRTAEDKPDVEDPSEATAVDVFRAMLDSVQFLDQSGIEADNNDRLYRTRTLLVNLPKAVRQAVVPEQYFRIRKSGKDIGWSFQSEELGSRQGKEGLIVALQSLGLPEDQVRIAVESEMFAMLDLSKADEAWVTNNVITRAGKKETVTEIGQSAKRLKGVIDRRMEDSRGRPDVRPMEQYSLTVRQLTKAGTKNVAREVEPFYISQAIATMLPRLVPNREAKGYLFSVWVPSEQEIVLRYLDVEPARSVSFDGTRVVAATVKDRIGLEGEPTLHYISPEGKYLGTFNPSSGVSVVATDLGTLTKLWPDATIQRPRILDSPAQ